MAKKPKFNPLVTRIELNPEQSVLMCPGSGSGYGGTVSGTYTWTICVDAPKRRTTRACTYIPGPTVS